MIETHKKGQGVIVRRVAFYGLAVLLLWGGQALYGWLVAEFPGTKSAIYGEGEGWHVPVLNQRLNWAFAISWAVTLLSLFVLHVLLNKPRSAEFLIETDNEVKKVTWPSWRDAWRSSLIVIGFVITLTGFLLISDFLLNGTIKWIL